MNNNNSNQKPIELKDIHEILTDIHDAIKESSKWAKFAGMKEVKPVLESKLDSDVKRIVYALSNGKSSSYEIARISGNVSARTVSNYWQEWEKNGFGESIPVMGGGNRFKHSFDLTDLGIIVPELPKQEKQSASDAGQTEQQPTTEVESDAE